MRGVEDPCLFLSCAYVNLMGYGFFFFYYYSFISNLESIFARLHAFIQLCLKIYVYVTGEPKNHDVMLSGCRKYQN